MTTWSQDFTVKSNARRAAKKADIDVSTVVAFSKAGKTLYRYPLPDTNGLRRMAAHANGKPPLLKGTKKPAKAKAAPKAKAKAAPKPKAPPKSIQGRKVDYRAAARAERAAATPKADRGLKFTAVAALLRRAGGASITEICAATGWLPHTARARISVDVSKLLVSGEEITRTRVEGQSQYAIVKSKQLELPVGEAA